MHRAIRTPFSLRFSQGYKLNVNPTFCYLSGEVTLDSIVKMIFSLPPEKRDRLIKLIIKKYAEL